MILPANRLNTVSEYYFSAKLREVAQMNAEGKHVINLGIGNPDLPPSEATIEALCADARRPDAHGYQSYNGLPELRQAWAGWYARWYGVELDPDTEILPLIGSKEGVLHTTLALVNPGDGVLVPDPGYPTYTSASRLCEARVIPYPLDEARGWTPDFEAALMMLNKQEIAEDVTDIVYKYMVDHDCQEYDDLPIGHLGDMFEGTRIEEYKKYIKQW